MVGSIRASVERRPPAIHLVGDGDPACGRQEGEHVHTDIGSYGLTWSWTRRVVASVQVLRVGEWRLGFGTQAGSPGSAWDGTRQSCAE